MAEPHAIFKNGEYMNVNEGKMYIGVYRYPPSYPMSSTITAQGDVVLEIL